MKRTLTLTTLVILFAILLTGCCLSHKWQEATCIAPKTCEKCAETEGEPLYHDWTDATCTAPKTCTRCAETEGDALGHHWKDAECEKPKTCTVCSATEGDALGHKEGEWQIKTEPKDGELGTKCKECTICDKTLSTEEFLYPLFDMSFDEFVQLHNSTYSSNGWKIKEVSTGFSYFMSGKETAIVFHENLNNKRSNVISGYSTASLEEFNKIQIRLIDNGATKVDTETLATMMMLGGIITQPLAKYELSTFMDEFSDNWTVESNGGTRLKYEATIGDFKYILQAYVVDDSYSRVFYEWICQTAA